MEILQVEGLSFSYPDSKDVLARLALTVDAGEHVALIGPNGSGKTSLFLLLCGILKPAAGQIRINGQPVIPGKFNPDIAYLFQNPDDQLFSATVFDDVAFGPLNMNLGRAEVERRVGTELGRVGCSHLAQRVPHHLSGGEKRLVALATILSMTPKIILLDEPTSNLDSKNRRSVITLLNEIGETLFVSSHDLEFLLETCSRVIVLDQGRIVAQGEIESVLRNEELMKTHHLEKPHSLVPHAGSAHTHRH